MEARAKFSGKKVILIFILFIFSSSTYGQFCDSITPSFNVDLSADPNISWTSPDIVRDGFCCGASNPDNCLEFIITLNADAIAVSFNIASGAVPPGALFYQIDCGLPIAVGSPICLDGPGTFHLTFCKPGNNSNTFSITSYSDPIIGPDITLASACTGSIYANYYDESSITWTSIAPGIAGQYDYLLNTTIGSDTVSLTANGVLPSYIDYLVCGSDIGGCNPLPICDTIRVNLLAPFTASIDPDSLHLCFGDGPATLNAIVNGGTAPYSYLWSTGETSSSISAIAGNYWVEVSDSFACQIMIANSVITQDLLPIIADAGANQTLCNQSIAPVSLSGSVQIASGGTWSGGSNTFLPNASDLNATYIPNALDLSNGFVDLVLTSTGNNNCAADQDTMRIFFIGFTETFTLSINDISCNGAADGTADITILTGVGLQFSWDNGPFGILASATNLSPGLHDLTILNSLGCDTSLTFSIAEPTILNASLLNSNNILCNGDLTGSAEVEANGGTLPYVYSWNVIPAQNSNILSNVSSGTYTCTITDSNNCLTTIDVTISEPLDLVVALGIVPPSCNGFSNGAISSVVAGGVAPYDYIWSNGFSSSNIYDVVAGNYSVIVSDSNGCAVIANAIVSEPTALIGTISADTVICPGSTLDLNVNVNGGTGTLDYVWTPGGEITSTINVSPFVNTNYSCTITDNNGCELILTSNVDMNQMNSSDISAFATSVSICDQDSVGLSANYSGSASGVILSWNHCPACPTNGTIYEYPTATTDYVISATNLCGQIITDTVQVIVNSLPLIDLNPIMGSVCPGNSVTFMNNGTNNSNWDYVWNFGDGASSTSMNPSHIYFEDGVYPVSLTVTDNNGCTASLINGATVMVHPQAIASFTVNETELSTIDPTVELTNFSTGATSFSWNFGDGQTSNNTNEEHTYSEAGFYSIVLFANNPFGCNDSTFVSIQIKADYELFVPNAFTPDGDEHNNTFFSRGYGISDDDFTFQIFNRWGDLIFESHDMEIGWDGTNKKGLVNAQDGTYTWVVYFKDLNEGKHRKEGHVSLLK